MQDGTRAGVVLHPVERLLRTPGLTTETLRMIRRHLGLDRSEPAEQLPLAIQEPKP